MTERIVRPVRAWADYDEWSVYIEDYWSGTDNPLVDRQWFRRYDIPKHGPDRFRDDTGAFSVVHSLYRPSAARIGPLRSLRVLYENGWWLRLEPLRGPTTTAIHDWLWYLHQEQDAPEIPHGQFTEDKDSEAVERAMIVAAAWFSQRQEQD